MRASSLPLPGGGRVRVWKEVVSSAAEARPDGLPPFDALDNIADGACVNAVDGCILATNQCFRDLYDVARDRAIVGLSLEAIIAEAWAGSSQALPLPSSIRNGLRCDGAAFKVELPRDRWRRVITRRSDDSQAYTVHADVTSAKRQYRELVATQESLKAAIAELGNLPRCDPLTSLPNRRLFDAQLAAASAAVCVLMIDVDHFKAVNDRHGHAAGDACLRRVADIIGRHSRLVSAMPARIGGEEFAVLVEDGGSETTAELAEAIRAEVAKTEFGDITQGIRLTVSVGVGATKGRGAAQQGAADRALTRTRPFTPSGTISGTRWAETPDCGWTTFC